MVAITIVLAALVLLMVLGMIPSWSRAKPPEPPAEPPITIINISHISPKTGKSASASRVYLLNNGCTVYKNNDLKAVFYRDGWRVTSVSTLNGYLLIKSHHDGVQYLEGEGCCSRYWNPGEIMVVDIADRTFIRGSRVTVEIIDRQTNEVISKHTVIA
jgi:hypothetical protein